MPDDLQNKGPQDRSRISLLEPHEVQSWADKFDVSKERLSEAVKTSAIRPTPSRRNSRGWPRSHLSKCAVRQSSDGRLAVSTRLELMGLIAGFSGPWIVPRDERSSQVRFRTGVSGAHDSITWCLAGRASPFGDRAQVDEVQRHKARADCRAGHLRPKHSRTRRCRSPMSSGSNAIAQGLDRATVAPIAPQG